jgi:peptide/nickel transport system ATP-binding protein
VAGRAFREGELGRPQLKAQEVLIAPDETAPSHPATAPAGQPLLEVRNLSVEFDGPGGVVPALRGVGLRLEKGRTLAVVGESGSGKSTLVGSINGLLADNARIVSGQMLFEGQDLLGLDERAMWATRGAKIGLVPQNPMTNLNPLQRVGVQIREALEIHKLAAGRQAALEAVELLALVGLPEPARRARQYPHELSGGMRQRALIAMGLACRPRLLIADEPTSALDVTVQRVILDELDAAAERLGASLLLVTHDIALAVERAHDVLVLYRGRVVEHGPAAIVWEAPAHEYTKRLITSAPTLKSKPLVAGWSPVIARTRPCLLEAIDLRKEYSSRPRVLGKKQTTVAVAGSSFTIERGQTVAIVGESGSGKSTTARMLLKLEAPTGGDVLFDGKEVTALSGRELRAFRRRVQPVFQNATGSLDARFTISQCIEEPLILFGLGSARERMKRVGQLLEQVGLPLRMAERRPAEISGGQAQRVAIARALALSPDLIVLDEAVSALDVIVQRQIVELLVALQR